MIWLSPLAAVALVALAAPILVHILARQRATRVLFPTLRFIEPRQLASIRRRALEDIVLLAVRAAIFVCAAGAVAGPFVLTAARRRAWDARTIRADVVDADPRQGLTKAVAWLAQQPPGRREVVVRSPLPLGSITAADIAAVPAFIGIRFEPVGTWPASRSARAPSVVENGRVIDRELTLNAERTSVRDVGSNGPAASTVEIVAAEDPRSAVEDLRAALARRRVPTALPGRAGRIVFSAAPMKTAPISEAWMADAAAAVARDVDSSIDGSSLEFGSVGDRFVVVTHVAATDPRAAALVESVARSLGPPAEQTAIEILPIPQTQLHLWTREPGPAGQSIAPGTLDRDDRRWLWAATLLLLLIEGLMRRQRGQAALPEVSRAA
jgi:Aerotolerance regulator N-terminal